MENSKEKKICEVDSIIIGSCYSGTVNTTATDGRVIDCPNCSHKEHDATFVCSLCNNYGKIIIKPYKGQ